MENLPVRTTARLVVLDPADRVLLMELVKNGEYFWITPGGRVEDGESLEEAAWRELAEETGFHSGSLLGKVGYCEHVLEWEGITWQFKDNYFAMRVSAAEPNISGMTGEETRVFVKYRWWSLPELSSTKETIRPRSLVRVVQEFLSDGVPEVPIPIER